jgi:hypothetical protein
MQIDYDELKKMLDTFIEAEGPFITLGIMGFPEDEGKEKDKFLFHLLLLIENELISNAKLVTGDPEKLGLSYRNRRIATWVTPIRLTQSGHDLAKAFHQKPILEKIKKELADAPFDLVKDISKQWLTKFVKDKLGFE